MSTNPIVYVVDDDRDIREALTLLGQTVQLDVLTFSNAHEFLDTYSSANRPSCLVLDVRLPGISGLELQRRLNARNIRIPTIVVTGHAEVSMAVQAMRAGAVDFLEKPLAHQDLLDRIQHVLESETENQRYLEPGHDVVPRLEKLSARERDVLRFLVLGKNSKQIGVSLGITPKTVARHRSNLLDKVGVDSVVELVRIIGSESTVARAS